MCLYLCFFFNYTATTESYTYVRTLALNDALPIYQHLVGIDFRRGDDLELHRVFRRTVALAANHPAIHVLRHMADRRNLADLVKILVAALGGRSEEHTSELQSLMRKSYAVFCLKKKIHIYILNQSQPDTTCQ